VNYYCNRSCLSLPYSKSPIAAFEFSCNSKPTSNIEKLLKNICPLPCRTCSLPPVFLGCVWENFRLQYTTYLNFCRGTKKFVNFGRKEDSRTKGRKLLHSPAVEVGRRVIEALEGERSRVQFSQIVRFCR